MAGTGVVRGFSAAVLLALAACGCAQRTDWIEGTLVTVDVNGNWTGMAVAVREGVGSGSFQAEMELTLTQRGPKVVGDCRIRTTKVAIEGTVRGDVLSFAASGGRLRAEATVTGDEMDGQGMGAQPFSNFRLKLSRRP